MKGFRDILAQKVTGSTPAKTSFEITTVHSSEEFGLAIGAGFNYRGGLASVGLEASFDYTKSDDQSRTLLKYVQVYYTLDLDIDKANPSDWFKNPDSVDLSQISGMPIYISSVKYGRMVLFTIESKESAEDVKAALELAVESVSYDATLKVNTNYSRVSNNSTIKATVIGGSGADDAKAVTGLAGVIQYIKQGGNYTKKSPALPLAYTMRSIHDNSVMKSIFANEYNIRNCTPLSSKYRVTIPEIKIIRFSYDDDGVLEIYGNIQLFIADSESNARKNVAIESMSVWNKSCKKQVAVHHRDKGENLHIGYKGSVDWDIKKIRDGMHLGIKLDLRGSDTHYCPERAAHRIESTKVWEIKSYEFFKNNNNVTIVSGPHKITLVLRVDPLPSSKD